LTLIYGDIEDKMDHELRVLLQACRVLLQALRVLYLVLELIACVPYVLVAHAAKALHRSVSRRPKLAALLAFHAVAYFHVLMIQMQAATLAG
jgi:hypothetical protein